MASRKKSFILLSVLLFLVMMSITLSTFIHSNTLNQKQYNDHYLNIQANLLLKSATEIALEYIKRKTIQNKPIEKINYEFKNFTITIDIIIVSNNNSNNNTSNDINNTYDNYIAITDIKVSSAINKYTNVTISERKIHFL
jgi:hypothetical protein